MNFIKAINTGRYILNSKVPVFVAIFLATIFCGRVSAQQKLLEFGLWADCQYADIDDTQSRTYRASKDRLHEAIAEFNRLKLPFSISLGDIVDRDYKNFTDLEPVLATADSTIYYVLGNHDFMPSGEQMAQKTLAEGIEEPYYYSIVKGGVRVIILNTNELTLYSSRYSEFERARTLRYRDSLQMAGVALYDMNGSVSATQLQWLEDELKQAQKYGQIVIVMSHHPLLYLFNQVVAQNAEQIRAVLERYSCVKAHLGGHFHHGGYAKRKGIHYLIVSGMVEKNEDDYFSKITIFDDRIVVEGNSGHKREMKFN